MADQLELPIVLDDSQVKKTFDSIEKQAEKSAKGVGDSFSDGIRNSLRDISKSPAMANLAGGFFLAKEAIGIASAAMEKFVSTVQEGEKISAINRQFEALTSSVGIAASALRDDLGRAADGLVDDSNLIEIANRSLITLGETAKDLPALLDLARRSSAAFGGTVEENFQKFSDAIATGQTRQLKLLLGTETADQIYRKFAQSIGVTVAQLSEQGKQQAIANRLIEVGAEKTKDIDLSLSKATNNITRANVAFKDMSEVLAQVVSNSSVTQALFESMARSSGKLKDFLVLNFLDPAKNASAVSESLRNKIELLKKSIEFQSRTPSVFEVNKESIQKMSAELEKLQSKLRSMQDNKKEGVLSLSPSTAAGAQGSFLNEQSVAIEAQRSAEIRKIRLDAEQERLATQEAALQNKDIFGVREIEQLSLFESQKTLIEQQNANDMNLLKAQLAQDQVRTEEEKQALIEAAAVKGSNRLLALETKKAAHEKQLNQARLTALHGFFGQVATLQQSSSRELFEVGKVAAISQAVIDGYAAVQGAFKIGSSIGGPILGGAFAVAAAAAAASNVAKIAATNFGDSSIGSAGPGAGGGISAGPDLSSPNAPDLVALPEVERDPKTAINVNIEGSVFDSDETGLRVVKIIESAFDRQGVQVRGAFT